MGIDELHQLLQRIDGRGYRAYKDLQGQTYCEGDLEISFDYIQGDPFASPSRIRVSVPAATAALPTWATSSRPRRVASEDVIARAFAEGCREASGRSGSGKSGLVQIDAPEQEVLERSCVNIGQDRVEARLTVGLPARGRRVLGRAADELLAATLPALARRCLLFESLDADSLRLACETNEDAAALRDQLGDAGLVGFIADGAVLPRTSGIDQRPMSSPPAVAFSSPPELSVTLSTPNAGEVSGMGIPRGISLIVGGGFHGKSTLLSALERGVYNHRPGDGREQVVAVADAVSIRAEDGRSVAGVDISAFINNLPTGADTTAFSTENASGSTSQATNIAEALEAGAGTLLIDEDTAATNFMLRDAQMAELVAAEQEPITPFLHRARALYRHRGVSSILVVGGCGDYFGIADTVVRMDAYRASDATAEAKAIAARHGATLPAEADAPFAPPKPRTPDPRSIDPSKGRRDRNIKARGFDTISFGESDIDLGAVAQIVSPSQMRAMGEALALLPELGPISVSEFLDAVEARIARDGLDRGIGGNLVHRGDLAEFRRFELAAALNRLRTPRV